MYISEIAPAKIILYADTLLAIDIDSLPLGVINFFRTLSSLQLATISEKNTLFTFLMVKNTICKNIWAGNI